jgi:serine/threonine protein kinase
VTGNQVIHPLRPSDPRGLGAYRIVGRIGRGGMGTVFLAEGASGERAAVKVINPDLADDETFRERFRREVESARRVRRFCTAPVLDAQLDGEPLFIVTEYVDGPNLDDFVRESGPMRGSSLEHLAVGVATALTAIHGAGVVHRDLKPANVLLSSVGPRVIDFGIARALDTISGATRTGQFIGTPAYMAPELVSGQGASPASDVFAWGCVVAYAGTGRAPFEGPTVPAVLYQISHGDPAIAELDESLRDLVAAALAKDPAQRPSAQQLLDRLTGRPHAEAARTAEAVTSTWSMPPGRPTLSDSRPAARKSRFGRAAVVAAAAAALVLVLAGFLLLRGSGGPPGKTVTVFSDDFSNTDSGWSGSTFFSGSGYFQGGYRLDADGDFNSVRAEAAPVKGALPQNVLVSADATAKAGPGYGQLALFCRGNVESSDISAYSFLVRADGQGTLIRKETAQKGSKELIQKASAPGFKKNQKNRLQAACEQKGSEVRLRLWVNGDLAAEITDGDGPLGNGSAGVMARLTNGGSGGDTQAIFDNFDISQIR